MVLRSEGWISAVDGSSAFYSRIFNGYARRGQRDSGVPRIVLAFFISPSSVFLIRKKLFQLILVCQ